MEGRGIGARLELNNRLIFQTTVLGLILISSSIAGLGGSSFPPAPLPEAVEVKAQTAKIQLQTEKLSKTEKSITVEEYVRNYFSDIPVMVEIAKCESRFRQHDESGGVIHGEKNYLDRGVMQINEFYHNENSLKLGFNIMTLEGNTAYARYLFERYGVKPWNSSYGCWGNTAAYAIYRELAVK